MPKAERDTQVMIHQRHKQPSATPSFVFETQKEPSTSAFASPERVSKGRLSLSIILERGETLVREKGNMQLREMGAYRS